jgi:DNA modification methylase
MASYSLPSSKLHQLQMFDISETDPLASDFQRILRTVSNQESDYASHNLHPYPAKFIPYYPQIFIKHLSKEGNIVVDPMCGAGTTLIEASLAKRNGLGIEIDPIGSLISSVSTTPLTEKTLLRYEKSLFAKLEADFAKQRHRILSLPSQTDFPNQDIWFRPETLQQLLNIRDAILDVFPSNQYKRFALCCLSAIVRDVSNADPRDIFPQRNLNLKVRPKKDVLQTYRNLFAQNKRKILEFSAHIPFSRRGRVTFGDAREMPYPNDFADLVFTSPPYAYAIDYARVHQLSTLLLFMSNEHLRVHRKKYIGTDRVSLASDKLTTFDGFEFARAVILDVFDKDKKCGLVLYKYFKDMTIVTRECYRILKPGGYLVYVIGNSTIKKTPLSTDKVFLHVAKECGFNIERTYERPYFVYRMARKRNTQSNTIKKDVFIISRK